MSMFEELTFRVVGLSKDDFRRWEIFFLLFIALFLPEFIGLFLPSRSLVSRIVVI
jgi:hypothetical protein